MKKILSTLLMFLITFSTLAVFPSKVNAQGSSQQLTTNPYNDRQPSWSLDGTKILYTAFSGSWYRHIWIMNSDGSGKTQLTSGNIVDEGAVFSPDGTKIAFMRWGFRGDYFDLMLMDADGSNMQRLTFSGIPGMAEGTYNFPQWSQDGSRLIFAYLEGTTGTPWENMRFWICTLKPDGTDLTVLGRGIFPKFILGDTKILFNTDHYLGGDLRIAIMNADGAGIEYLTGGPADHSPDMAAISHSIVFTRAPAFGQLGDLYLMNEDGSNLGPLTSDGANIEGSEARWSPDEEYIVYTSVKSGNQDIWKMRTSRALIINPKWIDVPSAYYPTVVNALNNLAIPYDIRDPDTLSLSILNEYDVVFLPELGHTQPGWESFDAALLAAMLENYVDSGGGLLYAPGYLRYSSSPIIFGFQDLELRLDMVDLEIIDNTHPVGSGFRFGERMYGNEADMYVYPEDAYVIGKVKDVETNADEGIGLATFQRGLGKVVATSFQIGWMSSGPAIYNGVPAEKWETLTKNAISWLLSPIVNQPPVADFEFYGPKTSFTREEEDDCEQKIYVGSKVEFDADLSDDPDGDIVSYTWDFGDGSDLLTTTEEVMHHPYAVSGPYTVTLTVTDDKGATGHISKDIFIYPLEWELFVEIDYMAGHEPTSSALTYIENYYRDNGVRVSFSIGTEFSDVVDDPTPGDNAITIADFWIIEATFNDYWRYDDRAFGVSSNGRFDLKEKWVLFGTVWAENIKATGVTLGGNTKAGNYIFIADQTNDDWAIPQIPSVSPEDAETVASMHEIGHSIGILVLDKDGNEAYDPWRGGPEEGASVMAKMNIANCTLKRYSPAYWKKNNLDDNHTI